MNHKKKREENCRTTPCETKNTLMKTKKKNTLMKTT